MSKSEDQDNKKLDENSSYMGIPAAPFVEDVDAFMKKNENSDFQAVMRRLDEQLNKYKFMEIHLLSKRKKLKSQVPDIKSSLEIVNEMKSRKDNSEKIKTHFMLSDQVYMKAEIPPTNKVCLWLGANVMLEYGLVDAEALLSKNLNNAVKHLSQIEHDLDFLSLIAVFYNADGGVIAVISLNPCIESGWNSKCRNQCTTTEVNRARIYNWDVKKRRAAKEASQSS